MNHDRLAYTRFDNQQVIVHSLAIIYQTELL